MIEIQAWDPKTLLLIALLNPAVIVVGFLMGRKADQAGKILLAGFAASAAGFLLYWLGGEVGLFRIHALGGEAAIFVVQFFWGLIWSALGYKFRRAG